MASDNVVRPQFGAARRSTVPQPSHDTDEGFADMFDAPPDLSQLTQVQRKQAETDLFFLITNQEYARSVRDKLQVASDTIFSLRGFVVDKESIRIRRKGLAHWSLPEILQAIALTSEPQWRSQPSYIGALALEHHARVQLALAMMPKPAEQE